jgi:type I restriction enzyme M protein
MGIPACIAIADRKNAADRKGIFIIDASAAYRKGGNKNISIVK